MRGKAFSSEVETGSRQENASKQESRAPFRFHRNGKGSGAGTPDPRLHSGTGWFYVPAGISRNSGAALKGM
jgi:hypothetical protein